MTTMTESSIMDTRYEIRPACQDLLPISCRLYAFLATVGMGGRRSRSKDIGPLRGLPRVVLGRSTKKLLK